MGILSHLKFIKKDFVDISEFQPKYLKEFGGKKLKINHIIDSSKFSVGILHALFTHT